MQGDGFLQSGQGTSPEQWVDLYADRLYGYALKMTHDGQASEGFCPAGTGRNRHRADLRDFEYQKEVCHEKITVHEKDLVFCFGPESGLRRIPGDGPVIQLWQSRLHDPQIRKRSPRISLPISDDHHRPVLSQPYSISVVWVLDPSLPHPGPSKIAFAPHPAVAIVLPAAVPSSKGSHLYP